MLCLSQYCKSHTGLHHFFLLCHLNHVTGSSAIKVNNIVSLQLLRHLFCHLSNVTEEESGYWHHHQSLQLWHIWSYIALCTGCIIQLLEYPIPPRVRPRLQYLAVVPHFGSFAVGLFGPIGLFFKTSFKNGLDPNAPLVVYNYKCSDLFPNDC